MVIALCVVIVNKSLSCHCRMADSAVETCLMRWMHYQLALSVRPSAMLLLCSGVGA